MSNSHTTTEQQIINDELALRDSIVGLVKNEDGSKTVDPKLLDINMFIEAGAGAGKTYTIVERIMNQLSIGKKPGEIVVITFTNKAAEELRSRIASKLNKKVNDKEYANVHDVLENALYHLDDMNISTIHSFCFRLLKERCFDIELPMDIGLLDNTRTDETKHELFEQWLATLSVDAWDEIVGLDINEKNRKQLKADIYDIYDKTCTAPIEKKIHIEADYPKPLNALAKEVFDGLEIVFASMINKMVNGACVKNWSDIFALDSKLKKGFLGAKFTSEGGIIDGLKEANPNYVDLLKIFLKNGTSSEDRDAKTGKKNKEKVGFVHFVPGTNTGKLKGKNEYDLDLYEDVVNYLESESEKIDVIYNDAIRRYRNGIAKLAEKARIYYRLNKKVTSLTNDELLEYTRDMVLGSRSALEYFANKYTCYYVDEFQDTDNVQESFIWKLAAVVGDTSKLRPGALFVVGDPKQSIYRFRGAEPQVYLEVQDRMSKMPPEMAQVHKLKINFRSNGLVIKWVNDKFSQNTGFAPIMNDPTGTNPYVYQSMLFMKGFTGAVDAMIKPDKYGIEIDPNAGVHPLAGMYKYAAPDIISKEKMESATEENVAIEDEPAEQIITKYPFECAVEEETEAEKNDNLVSEREKQLLTDLILNLSYNEQYQITRYDKDNNPYLDQIHFEDFMILCHGKGRMNAYLDYLSLRGIPIMIAGDTTPADILEINAFVRIYTYTANQKDQQSRIAALEVIRELGIADNEADIEKYGIALLNKLYEGGRNQSPYGLAEYILANLSVIIRKTRRIPALEVLSIQTKIRQMIETVCRDNYGTPKAVAEKFNEYLQNKVEHELILDPNTKAVQFMNIHKSKGLEGNIVVLVDRRAKDSLDVDAFWHDNPVNGEREFYSKPKQYRDFRNAEKNELLSERRRLEYVTATRAGQVFIFMDMEGGDTTLFNGTEGVSEYGLEELPSISSVIHKVDPHEIPMGSGSDVYSISEENDRLADRVNNIEEDELIPDCQRISPSRFEDGNSPTKNKAIRRSIEVYHRTEADEISTSLLRPTGNVLGTTMHRALELLVDRYKSIEAFDDELKQKVIRACVAQAVNEELEHIAEISNGEKTYNAQIYREFLCSVLTAYYEWLKAEKILEDVEIHTEFPFSYYEDSKNAQCNQLELANKHLKESEKLKAAPVWMNGSADLLIVKPGEWIRIIDYKSDNDYFVPEADFSVSMSEKYIGQLDNYRYAMSKLFKDIPSENITMSIISFSQKDLDGNLLPGKEVRVRCTQI